MANFLKTLKAAIGIIKAIISRIVFSAHGFICIWRVTVVKRNPVYWCLTCSLLLLLIETVVTLRFKKGGEWKWVCPSVLLYLATAVPAIWFLELDLLDRRIYFRDGGAEAALLSNDTQGAGFTVWNTQINIPINLIPDDWCKVLEQILLLCLIIGRWLLPKGEITREQLSQLLLVYIGMAADIIELFEAFKEQEVRYNSSLTMVILSLWTASLMQFTLVVTATKSKRMRHAMVQEANPTSMIIIRGRPCCPTEVLSIFISVMLQDGPFLVLRMLLIFRYNVLSYTNLFFTSKNSLVIVLQFYRLVVLFTNLRKQRRGITKVIGLPDPPSCSTDYSGNVYETPHKRKRQWASEGSTVSYGTIGDRGSNSTQNGRQLVRQNQINGDCTFPRSNTRNTQDAGSLDFSYESKGGNSSYDFLLAEMLAGVGFNPTPERVDSRPKLQASDDAIIDAVNMSASPRTGHRGAGGSNQSTPGVSRRGLPEPRDTGTERWRTVQTLDRGQRLASVSPLVSGTEMRQLRVSPHSTQGTGTQRDNGGNYINASGTQRTRPPPGQKPPQNGGMQRYLSPGGASGGSGSSPGDVGVSQFSPEGREVWETFLRGKREAEYQGEQLRQAREPSAAPTTVVWSDYLPCVQGNDGATTAGGQALGTPTVQSSHVPFSYTAGEDNHKAHEKSESNTRDSVYDDLPALLAELALYSPPPDPNVPEYAVPNKASKQSGNLNIASLSRRLPSQSTTEDYRSFFEHEGSHPRDDQASFGSTEKSGPVRSPYSHGEPWYMNPRGSDNAIAVAPCTTREDRQFPFNSGSAHKTALTPAKTSVQNSGGRTLGPASQHVSTIDTNGSLRNVSILVPGSGKSGVSFVLPEESEEASEGQSRDYWRSVKALTSAIAFINEAGKGPSGNMRSAGSGKNS